MSLACPPPSTISFTQLCPSYIHQPVGSLLGLLFGSPCMLAGTPCPCPSSDTHAKAATAINILTLSAKQCTVSLQAVINSISTMMMRATFAGPLRARTRTSTMSPGGRVAVAGGRSLLLPRASSRRGVVAAAASAEGGQRRRTAGSKPAGGDAPYDSSTATPCGDDSDAMGAEDPSFGGSPEKGGRPGPVGRPGAPPAAEQRQQQEAAGSGAGSPSAAPQSPAGHSGGRVPDGAEGGGVTPVPTASEGGGVAVRSATAEMMVGGTGVSTLGLAQAQAKP